MPKRAPDHVFTDLTKLSMERAFKAADDVAELLDHPQDRYGLAMNMAVNAVLYAAESDRQLREFEKSGPLDLHRTVMVILSNIHRSVEALPRGTDLRKAELKTFTVPLKR